MIRYYYRKDGAPVPRFFDAGEAIPKHVRCDDGKYAVYHFADNICGSPVPAVEAWRKGLPMESCGVGRVQADAEVKRMEKELGHPTEWRTSKYGGKTPIPHSNRERNEILRFNGFRDNDAGYSQYAGGKG